MTVPDQLLDDDGRTAGAAILDDVAAFLGRFLALPTPHALTVLVLWAAHAHAPEGTWYVTPRLVVVSVEPGSGKTRVLELLALLCPHPEMTISATVAALFRLISEHQITLLFDEVDAIFNPKNGGNYEDLRALLNAGYKRGATIARCVGDAKSMKVERFKVFSPVALGGLAGKIPPTITTRAVTIPMRRRAPGETVEPFRERDAEPEAEPLRLDLAGWVDSIAGALSLARPDMPDGVNDRPAEVWEPLLAIADAAGGDWPERAREACRYFVLNADPGELSLGVRLLADVRRVFAAAAVDRMHSADLVDALVHLEESRWADLYGKPLDVTRLAAELRKYGVQSKNVRAAAGAVAKGYAVAGSDGLADAWQRYLPDQPPHGVTAATAVTAQVTPAAPVTPVTPGEVTGVTAELPLTCGVTAVTPVTPQNGSARWRVSGEPA